MREFNFEPRKRSKEFYINLYMPFWVKKQKWTWKQYNYHIKPHKYEQFWDNVIWVFDVILKIIFADFR